jgi:hypothetical protein
VTSKEQVVDGSQERSLKVERLFWPVAAGIVAVSLATIMIVRMIEIAGPHPPSWLPPFVLGLTASVWFPRVVRLAERIAERSRRI